MNDHCKGCAPLSLSQTLLMLAVAAILVVSPCVCALSAQRRVPDGFPTIQAGIDASADGDIVVVADGVYTGDGNRDLDFRGKAVMLRSENGPEVTIIDCGGSELDPHRGFYFGSGEGSGTIVDGFTVRSGNAEYGAGIFCENGRPLIINCIITGNSARLGAGILCVGGPTIVNCEISGNSADHEGGSHGGGIYCYFGSAVEIVNCRISGNMALDYGGGVMCVESETTIRDSVITCNWAYNGGGISCYDQIGITLTNSTFSGNISNYGGGISLWNSMMTATNCTFTGNSGENGGGIFSYEQSDLRVANSILWGNSGEEVHIDSGTASLEYCNVRDGAGESWFGAGCIDMDPGFVTGGQWAGGEWVEGDHHLAAESICIDAGKNSAEGLPALDMDGNHRVWNGGNEWTVDLGAYEFDSERFTFTTAKRTGTGEVELGWCSTGLEGAAYTVWYSDGPFTDGMSWYLLDGDVPSGGPGTSWVDYSAPVSGQRFYRVADKATGFLLADIVGLSWEFLGTGRNLVSTPFEPFDTSLDTVVGDAVTGDENKYFSDFIESWNALTQDFQRAYYDTASGSWKDWDTAGAPAFDFRADRGYWVRILSFNPPASVCFMGKVATAQREMELDVGRNLCGSAYPVEVLLADSGLVDSGFTGSFIRYFSDAVEWWDNKTARYERVWYDTTSSTWLDWDGVSAAQSFVPGEGFWINVLPFNSPFTWTYPKPYGWDGS